MDRAMVMMQMRALATVANGIDPEDLDAFAWERDSAMSIGPIFQPTAWVESGFDTDRAWRDLAQDTAKYVRAVRKAAETIQP